MRICMLLVKHPPERRSPMVPELLERLRAAGATVEVRYPDDALQDLGELRVEHDLYVLKSGTEAALSVAGALHALGAQIVNPWPAAAALRDKAIATRVLQQAGVPVPRTWVAGDPAALAPLLAGGPVIVKPVRGSQGRGVQVISGEEDLRERAPEGGLAFAQRFHAPEGEDRKLYAVGGRIFGVKRTWPPRTYEEKVGRPFEVGPDLAELAWRCGEAFGLDLFGVDVVVSEGRPWVVDMQCFPGFKGVPEAAARLADAILAEARRASGRPRGPGAAARPRPIERELGVAVQLALEAGAVLRSHRAGPLAVSHKPGGEPVTPADLEADRLIRDGLAAAFPGDAVFSEETPDSPARLAHDRVWIVDPLDATSDYAAGGDEHCVSIGLAVRGRAVLGVVYNPARRELVAGARGLGVTLNGAPAAATDRADLQGARLRVSRKEWRRGLEGRIAAGGLPATPMASMAYKLARVAAGLDDGAFSLAPRKEWGTCAGVALVSAAGGQATLLDGSEIGFNRVELRQPLGLVAAGARLHGPLRAALGRLPASAPAITG
jgi:fructose-1,6-bisphosphatase/inositol monophosphatase family enzyme/glutathione synthase/RimK-type ligase-like ATP-grasp enzyme